jgi:hypothetical protein
MLNTLQTIRICGTYHEHETRQHFLIWFELVSALGEGLLVSLMGCWVVGESYKSKEMIYCLYVGNAVKH